MGWAALPLQPPAFSEKKAMVYTPASPAAPDPLLTGNDQQKHTGCHLALIALTAIVILALVEGSIDPGPALLLHSSSTTPTGSDPQTPRQAPPMPKLKKNKFARVSAITYLLPRYITQARCMPRSSRSGERLNNLPGHSERPDSSLPSLWCSARGCKLAC